MITFKSAAAVLCTLLIAVSTARIATAQSFVTTNNMTTARAGHSATLLNDGTVLLAGGISGNGGALSSAETYDPSTGVFSATGNMTTARFSQTATLLQNGQVLITGGGAAAASGAAALASAELYDPSTRTFSPAGNMTTPRLYQTATRTNNGNVLIAGGTTEVNSFIAGGIASAEIYNPSTGTFTPTSSLATGRYSQTATLLQTGKVLITGGVSTSILGGGVLASAQLYGPSSGTFSNTGSMTTARVYDSATLLQNGQVLVAGGAGAGAVIVASAELYDPSTGVFTPTGSMTTVRGGSTATRLENGKVLIAGGAQVVPGSTVLASAELYDPSSGTFSLTASMSTARTYFTATRLRNGSVLIAGGEGPLGQLASAELFIP